MKLFAALAALFMLAPVAQAEGDHGIGKILDDNMDLSYIDHVLTGRIGDRPVFAKPLEGQFGLSLWHRAEGENFSTELIRTEDGDLVGEVRSLSTDEEPVASTFKVIAIDAAAGEFTATIGERSFKAKITSDTMDGHHYIEPTFSLVFDDGFSYEFHLAGGQACMGCSLKLTYAITAMLHAQGLL